MPLNCFNFRLKALELPKMSKKLSLKRSGAIYNQKKVSRDNNSQNV